jgi:hypothetical protein
VQHQSGTARGSLHTHSHTFERAASCSNTSAPSATHSPLQTAASPLRANVAALNATSLQPTARGTQRVRRVGCREGVHASVVHGRMRTCSRLSTLCLVGTTCRSMRRSTCPAHSTSTLHSCLQSTRWFRRRCAKGAAGNLLLETALLSRASGAVLRLAASDTVSMQRVRLRTRRTAARLFLSSSSSSSHLKTPFLRVGV